MVIVMHTTIRSIYNYLFDTEGFQCKFLFPIVTRKYYLIVFLTFIFLTINKVMLSKRCLLSIFFSPLTCLFISFSFFVVGFVYLILINIPYMF